MTDLPPDPKVVLAAAQRLQVSMLSLGSRIEGLKRYGRTNRILIWVVGFLTLLQFALIGWSVQVARTASLASRQAHLTALISRQRCESGNDFIKVEKDLWEYVLTLSSGQNPSTPQQEQNLTSFRAYLAGHFQPRDCTQGT